MRAGAIWSDGDARLFLNILSLFKIRKLATRHLQICQTTMIRLLIVPCISSKLYNVASWAKAIKSTKDSCILVATMVIDMMEILSYSFL